MVEEGKGEGEEGLGVVKAWVVSFNMYQVGRRISCAQADNPENPRFVWSLCVMEVGLCCVPSGGRFVRFVTPTGQKGRAGRCSKVTAQFKMEGAKISRLAVTLRMQM